MQVNSNGSPTVTLIVSTSGIRYTFNSNGVVDSTGVVDVTWTGVVVSMTCVVVNSTAGVVSTGFVVSAFNFEENEIFFKYAWI